MQRLTSEGQSSSFIEDYVSRLRLALEQVPADEREHLLSQARAQIELELDVDRAAADDDEAVRSVLRRLGEPGAFADRLRATAPHREETEEVAATPEAAANLTACRSCRREVSVEAVSCPHCGAPYPALRGAAGRLRGAWRREWGREWKSKQTLFGLPLVHIAYGRDKNGKLRVAKGIIAIGQFAIGAITIAQFGVGALFGLGQFMLSPIAIGQFAFGLAAIGQFGIGLLFGLGQFATGYVAIGQVAFGEWVRAMQGFGAHVWDRATKDPQAVDFFRRIAGWFGF